MRYQSIMNRQATFLPENWKFLQFSRCISPMQWYNFEMQNWMLEFRLIIVQQACFFTALIPGCRSPLYKSSSPLLFTASCVKTSGLERTEQFCALTIDSVIKEWTCFLIKSFIHSACISSVRWISGQRFESITKIYMQSREHFDFETCLFFISDSSEVAICLLKNMYSCLLFFFDVEYDFLA